MKTLRDVLTIVAFSLFFIYMVIVVVVPEIGLLKPFGGRLGVITLYGWCLITIAIISGLGSLIGRSTRQTH